ncbi:hypothetical protein EMIHUDRAFT_252011 [Emiliania huxleyi CCMP1516]|uniref:Secreted protein n=2 Tax=Emiliania huxleyi TaxID=2903 RepID=A0A0D3KPN2_EMIH1|nr:hypothetical protein EMIHUDRAFT_252011 [Emiliania huxleyi CCMP1516]EOD37717.1 hypothetical protein EMIHUDRAFT_252011 [Emiliania huxleyi CCMP1516]|eukprot:XP_005790146.1 hypothetical protein EMIHUDRAFT_252011 [Emiliania huxleyi CCMP1516]
MSVLFFLLLLYALYIASIPFRVSTSLKPAQQLNRSLSRRSIISLTHFARCRLSPLPPAWAAVASLAGRASFHPAKSFLSHSMCSSLFIMRAVASSLSWIHLCTAPVAASATTCKFLVTPAPRRVLIFLGPLLRGFPHDRTQRVSL